MSTVGALILIAPYSFLTSGVASRDSRVVVTDYVRWRDLVSRIRFWLCFGRAISQIYGKQGFSSFSEVRVIGWVVVPRGSWTTVSFTDTEINLGMIGNETLRYTLWFDERSLVAQVKQWRAPEFAPVVMPTVPLGSLPKRLTITKICEFANRRKPGSVLHGRMGSCKPPARCDPGVLEVC